MVTGPDLIVATTSIAMMEIEDKAEATEEDKAILEETAKETTTTAAEETISETIIVGLEVTEEGADQVVEAAVASEEALDNSQTNPQNLPFHLVSQFF